MGYRINTWTAEGNLGKDPEQRTTAAGKTVTKASCAVATGWGDTKGTMWVDLVEWGDRPALMDCRKGDRVHFSGRLEEREWQGRDGDKMKSLQVTVTDLSTPPKEQRQPARDDYYSERGGSPPTRAPQRSAPPGDDEDIPF